MLFLAHNSKFDEDLLNRELKSSSIEIPSNWKWGDTIQFVEHHVPEQRGKCSLKQLCTDFEIDNEKEHQAKNDVRAIFQVLNKITEMKNRHLVGSLLEYFCLENHQISEPELDSPSQEANEEGELRK